MTKTGSRFNQFLLYLVGVMLMLALCVTFRNNTILMTVKKIGNPWLCLSCLLLSYDGWKNFYQAGYGYYLSIGCNIENIIMKYYKYCIKSFYIIFLLSIMMIFDVENPIKSVLFQLLYFVTMSFVFPPISYILLIGKNKQRRCVEMVLPEILLSGICAYLFVDIVK
jgi:hypothetical protein